MLNAFLYPFYRRLIPLLIIYNTDKPIFINILRSLIETISYDSIKDRLDAIVIKNNFCIVSQLTAAALSHLLSRTHQVFGNILKSCNFQISNSNRAVLMLIHESHELLRLRILLDRKLNDLEFPIILTQIYGISFRHRTIILSTVVVLSNCQEPCSCRLKIIFINWIRIRLQLIPDKLVMLRITESGQRNRKRTC